MRTGWMWMTALMVLSGCGERSASPEASAAADAVAAAPAVPRPAPTAAPSPTARHTAALRSCATELGAGGAARRVAICRSVSPATRPPCNVANSCAAIDDEIARSCALFAGARDAGATPIPGCGADPMGAEAAADVIRRYYAAIDAHDYATAWTQWGDDGRPGQSFAAFQRGFADTRSVRVTIGAMAPAEGGAGSIYQTVPVTIDATLDDGRRQRFAGRYVVRRVNAIDGATASQRRWHIDLASLTAAKG